MAERPKQDGIKQKRCCGGRSRITPKGTPLHNRYVGIMGRCYQEGAINYDRYGGRGIKVCKEWQNFDNFARWAIDSGFSTELQIDRIDNDKGYSPENCRWITQHENARNKSDNIHDRQQIESIIRDYTMTPMTSKQIAEKYGDSAGNINNILHKRTWNIATKYDRYLDLAIQVKKLMPDRMRAEWQKFNIHTDLKRAERLKKESGK